MDQISEPDIRHRIGRDNPWWFEQGEPIIEASYPRRVYFSGFKKLAIDFNVRRATVLLGPRRVGKTVMVRQIVHEAIDDGFDPRSILYARIDAPVFMGMPLEKFLHYIPNETSSRYLVIFDEIQYLKQWEVHLKDLVDAYPHFKFIVTGSAAASLRLKSKESGAGRFSEFMLPPLTFYEFLSFTGRDSHLIVGKENDDADRFYVSTNINMLNEALLDYLNYGGYPEAVLNETIRQDAERFIRDDIIDKVLLKDLPSLYGISEIQELNRLFSFLAYNSGNEATLENISKASGISKPTIKRYMDYLESAFLIITVQTVDDNCRSMQRARNFKVYLNNPSMRSALFGPIDPSDSTRIGHLVESAVFSQWQHSPVGRNLRYARWRNDGEVDVVLLDGGRQRPAWIGEIKWSDRIRRNFSTETRSLATLLRKNDTINSMFFTTRTYRAQSSIEGCDLEIIPAAEYCYTVGRNTSELRNFKFSGQSSDQDPDDVEDVSEFE